MRFCVFGDLHICDMKNRKEPPDRAHARVPDFPRYTAMEATRKKLFAMAHAEKPDFVIQTGDLIEGGADSPRDMALANRELSSVSPEIYRAPGSHDLYSPRKKEYFGFGKENSSFIFLDYTDWSEEQKKFLISALEKAGNSAHVFVFGHAPLYLLARHFCNSAPFADEVRDILSHHDIDIYFCGHTHNQSVSRHGKLLQIAGSSVGYEAAPALPLDSFHRIGPADSYFWGFPEDHQPGFWTVDVNGKKIDCIWMSLHNHAELHIPERFGKMTVIPPHYDRIPSKLAGGDLWQIQCAWLNIFSTIRKKNDSEIFFNGISLGPVPENVYYTARRFILLPQAALSSIRESNELSIRFPSEGAFALGSITLDLLLLDGRRIRSKVSPELYTNGESIEFQYAMKYASHADNAETRTIKIVFDPVPPEIIERDMRKEPAAVSGRGIAGIDIETSSEPGGN